MKSRSMLTAALAAAGAALLTAAALAGPSSQASPQGAAARGGTLRVDNRNDYDFVDPSLAYFSHSWQLEWATQLTLVSYPDKDGLEGTRISAAAADLPSISADGKTYTFRVRPGFRFSDGKPVTAANFAWAINRALRPQMQSPAASFLGDVVGAQAVLDGKAATASGVKAKGNTLTISLTRVAPDFIARLTMPFFSAIPLSLPVDPNGVGAPLVSAGPYYLKEWTQRRTALIVRNPYWNAKQEPWKSLGRPANVDAMAVTIGNSLDATKLRLESNQVDVGAVPPAAAAELVQKYGINKGRFFIRKQTVLWYLALNNDRPLFKGNTKLRQSVNWAIDRPQMVRQHGFLGGGRTDQVLPPGMLGYKDWDVYPLAGVNATSLAKAKALAQGATRGGKAVMYTFNSSFGPTVAQVVQYNLKQIGVDVEIRTYDRVVQNTKSATKGEPFDISLEGWGADYLDPYNFANKLFDGTGIQETNNNNLSYFNDPSWNKRLKAAALLSGDARANEYAAIDRDLMKNAAPIAPYINTNAKILVGPDVGCYTYNSTGGTTNLVALCKK